MQAKNLSITTYNTHKGMSALNRKFQIDHIAKSLKSLQSDVIFLQEVQGLHLKRDKSIQKFVFERHDEIIAHELNYYNSYGKNAIFKYKHHGNAILSRTPIKTKLNINISTNTLEQRGVLHCQTIPQGWNQAVDCFCVHLNLMEQDRQKQYMKIEEYFEQYVLPDSPVILAGDFNDWAVKSQDSLEVLNLMEAFLTSQGFCPKTFPSKKPMLSLDRIFIRNLEIVDTIVHNDSPWNKLSDHLPITAILAPLNS